MTPPRLPAEAEAVQRRIDAGLLGTAQGELAEWLRASGANAPPGALLPLLDGMAALAQARGRPDLAIGYLTQAARVADRPGAAALLAVNQYQAGDAAGAERTLGELEARLSGELDPDHPEVARVGLLRAELVGALGRWGEARSLFEAARDRVRGALGEEHLLYREAQRGLARALAALGRPEEAETLLQAVLIAARTEPSTDLEVAALTELAMLRAAAERSAEAVAFLEEAVDCAPRRQGLSRGSVRECQLRLAAALRAADRLDEAEMYYRSVLQAVLAERGPGHPELAAILSEMGVVEAARGRPDAAEQCFAEAVAILEVTVGAADPLVGAMLLRLGAVRSAREPARAASELQRAWEVLARGLGEGHPAVAEALYWLASTRQREGKAEMARRLCAQAKEILDQAEYRAGPLYGWLGQLEASLGAPIKPG